MHHGACWACRDTQGITRSRRQVHKEDEFTKATPAAQPTTSQRAGKHYRVATGRRVVGARGRRGGYVVGRVGNRVHSQQQLRSALRAAATQLAGKLVRLTDAVSS